MMDISTDRSSQVPLSPEVDEMLQIICVEQKQQPANPNVRRKLADLGEEEALKLLQTIRNRTIKKNLNACILYYIKDRSSASPSPAKSATYTPDRSSLSCATTLNFMQDYGSNGATCSGNRFSPQWEALSTLEFRKQFLILSYIGTQRLENVVTVDLILELKDLGMIGFEEKVWKVLGSACLNKEDRCKILQWDSGRTLIYHCHVSPDGSYRFKGPYFSPLKTLLQKKLGDDNVLLVKLAEELNDGNGSANTSRESSFIYKKIAKEGIYVGLRRFRFFVFKDGGKEEKKKDPTSSSVKCYFVSLEGNELLAEKSIQEARSFFMHAHTVSSLSNYMIRLSLILSKTVSLEVDFNDVKVERIDDIECKDENGITLYDNKKKPLIYTDGTGYISPDIAVRCPGRIYKGKCTRDQETEPLLIQCRLFHEGLAVKGTLLVNKKLDKSIQVRPSMIKVEKDPKLANNPSVSSLEIVGTSYKPKICYLSKNLILLLSFGGVPNEYFLDLLEKALADAHGVFSSKRSALKVAVNHGDMDDLNAARMILSGIPLEESYLQYHLSILMKEEKKSLKSAKIPVPDSFYLMGTADPTGLLEKDEVCIIVDSGQISGTVLVYRNPGLHVGDVHVLKAKYVKELESYVGHSKFGIFFPCTGPRSLADEIAGGDFDGDMYWVSRNPQLLEFFKPSQPWKSASIPKDVKIPKPSDFSSDQLEDELIDLWLGARFNPSYTVGVAADSWMALMDRYLTIGDTQPEERKLMEENMLKLIDLYYDALDQPKKGGDKIEVPSSLRADVFPHYMGKDQTISYISKSVLGLIFDRVESFRIPEEDESTNVMVSRLPCFDVEVPRDSIMKWGALYEEYRKDMTAALGIIGEGRRETLDEVVKKYKRKLYDAEEFEDSPRSMDDVIEDAIAIFNVCYDHAEKMGKVGMCNFAWKVAGSALCKQYLNLQQKGEKFITCSPSILREIYS